jgi:AraC-like DNA-binding protein
MTETLFAFDDRNYQDAQKAYRGAGNQEYYLGDYSIEAGSVIDVRAERKAVGSSSIIRLKSRTRLFFRRSWSHIREDPTDVAVLWFVKRGRLCVSHQSGYTTANAGDFVVTRSMTPFFIECQTDDDAAHETLHMIVPAHVLRRYIAQDVQTGFTITAGKREVEIAERILTDVFEDEGDITDESAQVLLDSALSVLCHTIQNLDSSSLPRQSVSDRRLQEVLRFIDIHISDPKLSAVMVAKGCGISPRYLSFLLKLHGTPFSTLVWDQRLKMAARWIGSAKARDISISEIAYRVGFKSPAHFSRMFKRTYNMSPRAYRAVGPGEAVQDEAFALQ